MRQTLSADKWQQSVQHVRALLTLCLLTLSLTACMTVLAYRLSSGAALVLAQWVAGVSALLHLAVVGGLARLAVQAARIRKYVQSGGKQTTQSKQLRGSIRRVIGAMLLMILFSIAALALPVSLPVIMRVPEVGMLFVMLIGSLLIHRFNIRRACQRLSEDIPAAQHAAQRTLVL